MSIFTNYDASTSVIYSDYASLMMDRPFYIVTKPFEYYVGDEEDNVYVHIPLGYITDGASVPKCLLNIFPAWGRYGQATVIHDYLCEYLLVEDSGSKVKITRGRADKIFYEAMGVLKIPKWQKILFFIVVRLYSLIIAKDKPYRDPKRACVQKAILKHYELTGSFIFN